MVKETLGLVDIDNCFDLIGRDVLYLVYENGVGSTKPEHFAKVPMYWLRINHLLI